MDMSFINDMVINLNSKGSVFSYAFTGGKVLAIAFLLFRIIETYLRDFEDTSPKIGNLLNLFGLGLIIMSSDWIIDSIESLFAGIDASINASQSASNINKAIEGLSKYDLDFEQNMSELDTFSSIKYAFSETPNLIGVTVAKLLLNFINIADACVTASFLVQRIFFIQLLKFLFPLAIAFSTSVQLGKFFWSWILRYFGVFVLGIAYIGVFAFMGLVQGSLNNLSFSEEKFNAFRFVVSIAIVFSIKVKLLASVTSYINSYFQ